MSMSKRCTLRCFATILPAVSFLYDSELTLGVKDGECVVDGIRLLLVLGNGPCN